MLILSLAHHHYSASASNEYEFMLVLILDHKIRSFTRWTRVATFLITTGWQVSGFVIAHSPEFDKIFTGGK